MGKSEVLCLYVFVVSVRMCMCLCTCSNNNHSILRIIQHSQLQRSITRKIIRNFSKNSLGERGGGGGTNEGGLVVFERGLDMGRGETTVFFVFVFVFVFVFIVCC